MCIFLNKEWMLLNVWSHIVAFHWNLMADQAALQFTENFNVAIILAKFGIHDKHEYKV